METLFFTLFLGTPLLDVGLIGSPAVSGIAVDLVEAMRDRFLDAEGPHSWEAVALAMTSAAP